MIKRNTISFIVILVTLIIGVAIGFEVSEILIKKRFDEFRNVRQPEGFIGIFENIIKPDERQKALLEPIFLKYHKRIDRIMLTSSAQMNKQMDSLRTELKPFLSNEQIDRFDNEINRMKKMPPPETDHKGPPPLDQMRKGPPPEAGGNELPPESNDKMPPPKPQDR